MERKSPQLCTVALPLCSIVVVIGLAVVACRLTLSAMGGPGFLSAAVGGLSAFLTIVICVFVAGSIYEYRSPNNRRHLDAFLAKHAPGSSDK